MTDESIDNARNIEFAGAFAFEAIRNYVNHTGAAAAPRVPEELGGEAYVYFRDILKKAYEITNGRESLPSSEKEQIRQMALNSVREFIDKRESEGPTDDYEYLFFRAKQDLIERLLGGETPREVLASLKAKDGDERPDEGMPSAGL